MAEGIEGFEAHGKHEESPLTIPVAVTMSILAVLVAIATLLGHRAATEEIMLQTKATDQWAYYQSKNIRFHEMQSVVDLLAALEPADKEKTATMEEKYRKEVERYQDDKDSISEEAKKLEAEREVAAHKVDRFDAGGVILEIGLIVCSLTLLTNRRIFWYSGIILGVAGFFVTVSGFFLH